MYSIRRCIHANICTCNGRVWKPPHREAKVTVVNRFGNELLDMCKSSNLYIVNGRVESDKDGNYT